LATLGPGLFPAPALSLSGGWTQPVKPWLALRARLALTYEGFRRPDFYGHLGSVALPVGVLIRPNLIRGSGWQPLLRLEALPSLRGVGYRADFPAWSGELAPVRLAGQLGMGAQREQLEAWLLARLCSPLDRGPARAGLYGLHLGAGLGWYLGSNQVEGE
ncbi:MAG: hypothetical protein D6722_09795, partial [Bacteroidetes bacterium]